MFFYLYDKVTQDKKFEGVLTQIEHRLIDLGINGRVERMSLFKNMRELIEEAIKREAHTVVAVGNDATFSKAVSAVAPFPAVTLGFIPIVEGTAFGKLLGIPHGATACDMLSKRLSVQVDLGRLGKTFFLTSAELPANRTISVQCDGLYSISALKEETGMRIDNIGPVLTKGMDRLARAHDGKIEVVLTPPEVKGFFAKKDKEAPSVFPAAHVKITASESLPVSVDGEVVGKTPCEIEAVPKALRLIVGKERLLR